MQTAPVFPVPFLQPYETHYPDKLQCIPLCEACGMGRMAEPVEKLFFRQIHGEKICEKFKIMVASAIVVW